MTLTRDRRSELLSACPLFEGLGAEQVSEFAELATEVQFPADRQVARQGEVGTGFFVIVDGRARVVQDGETIASLGPGDFFGELSVLDRQPRIASVITEEPTRCLAIASWDFERVLLEHPQLAIGILRGLAVRMRAVTERHRQ